MFYMFSSMLLAAALGVTCARTTMHSVLFLIFAFLNAAGLFLLAGAEFLALTLVIVYVGAIAVLFLFAVMMLPPDSRTLKPVGLLLATVLAGELVAIIWLWEPIGKGSFWTTDTLGRVLYTQYGALFQLAGVVLLIAMMGAIVLTQRQREDRVKKRSRGESEENLRLVDVLRS